MTKIKKSPEYKDLQSKEIKESGIYSRPPEVEAPKSGVSIKMTPANESPNEEETTNQQGLQILQEIEDELRQKIHNINSPLAASVFSINHVLSETENDEPLTEEIRNILMDAIAAIQLASEIAQNPVPSLEKAFGRIPLKTRTIKIEDVLEKATGPFEQKCQLNIRGDLEAAVALGDPEHLSQVIYNIIDNGIKYNESPIKKIEILVLYSPRWTSILIRDNGLGVPEEDQEKIFEKGYRSSSTEDKEGSGIGLFYCKKVIEQMGGKIHLERNNIVPGSSFLIELMNLSHS